MQSLTTNDLNMTKYTLELIVKYPTEISVVKIDSDTKSELEESSCFNDDAAEVFYNADDYITTQVVIAEDDFLGTDTFSLEVKDENGNVVYKTTDTGSITTYPYYDEDKDEDVEAPNFKREPVEVGDYLIENNTLKWTTISFELETDSPFDPSKLSFYPCAYLDDILCEDDIFLSQLRYDNKEMVREWDYNDNYGLDYGLSSYNGENWTEYRLNIPE